MGYRQLTQKQRYQVFARLKTGASQRQIARKISNHSSTVSREICRNIVCHGYDLEQAHILSDPPSRLTNTIEQVLQSRGMDFQKYYFLPMGSRAT